MKKSLILLILLSTLITTGCLTTPKNEIALPVRPEREEMPHCTSINDVGLLISYYESLVQKWELWGNKTIEILNNSDINVMEIENDTNTN
jgi:hypothetical protein